eukprot:CAMPEP_0197049244 /NCGR_PEP_ID=MMETSP1384-20130603/24429_1 /TAXON_ID=29189 /ORGANISM="Ammonia sp." /LENGTH=897 /DNA_ID=CAMNT_0042481497 /DNA_START=39 /DNA_END=2732 /DNA_ORIENTATION=-
MSASEIQSVWDQAIRHINHNDASDGTESTTIPKYCYKYLHQLIQDLPITHKLPLILEQTLQSYLNKADPHNHSNSNHNRHKHMNVLVLLDIAITISFHIVNRNASKQCLHSSCDNKLCDDRLCLFIIHLLDAFCQYLRCDELSIIVSYLTNRTHILCKLTKKWLAALKQHNKPKTDLKAWHHTIEQNIELAILKFCNKVLFRLNSSSNDIEKRGQFLVFLANLVDIDSRSGQNFAGQFHLENITKPEPDDIHDDNNNEDNNHNHNHIDPEHEENRKEEKYDENLYHAVWELQDVFRDPRSMGASNNAQRLQQFQDNLHLVLATFKNNQINVDEANNHFKTKLNFHHQHMHQKQSNCKYLTSPRLFNKQLANPSFRRYLLVQTLIFLKSHNVKIPQEHRPKITPIDKFTDKQQQWFSDTYAEIVNHILPSIPPNGKSFTNTVKCILNRDENWLTWKYNKKELRCHPLKRSLGNMQPVILDSDMEDEYGDDDDVEAQAVAEAEDDEDIDVNDKKRCMDLPVPPTKKRKLNYSADYQAYLQRHRVPKKKAMLMGDRNLCNTFKFIPEALQSQRNNNPHYEVLINNNAGEMGVEFLRDYLNPDFERILSTRLDSLAAERRENEEIANSQNEALFNDQRNTFANLRIMRDFHHDMFATLCPMASNPSPGTFQCNFLLQALQHHDPELIKPAETTHSDHANHKNNSAIINHEHNHSDSASSRKHNDSDSDKHRDRDRDRDGDKSKDKEREKDRTPKKHSINKPSTPNSTASATTTTTAAPSSTATNHVSSTTTDNAPVSVSKKETKTHSSTSSNGNGYHHHHDRYHGHDRHHSKSRNGYHSKGARSSSSSSNSSSTKVIHFSSSQKKDARDEHEKMQERRRRFQTSSGDSKRMKNGSGSSHRR